MLVIMLANVRRHYHTAGQHLVCYSASSTPETEPAGAGNALPAGVLIQSVKALNSQSRWNLRARSCTSCWTKLIQPARHGIFVQQESDLLDDDCAPNCLPLGTCLFRPGLPYLELQLLLLRSCPALLPSWHVDCCCSF